MKRENLRLHGKDHIKVDEVRISTDKEKTMREDESIIISYAKVR